MIATICASLLAVPLVTGQLLPSTENPASANAAAFIAAASRPNATGYADSFSAGSQVYYYNSSSTAGSFLNHTNPLIPRQNYEYGWHLNISNVVLPQPNALNASQAGAQVNAISELVYSDTSVQRINSENRTLAVFRMLSLPDNVTAAGQTDNGTCIQTLGLDCVQQLLQRLADNPDNIPTLPPACQSILGYSSWKSAQLGELSSLFFNESLPTNSTNPTPEGYYFSATRYSQYPTINIGLSRDGLQRSAYYSSSGPITALDNYTAYYQSYWTIRPTIVVEYSVNNTFARDRWASMTCTRGRAVTAGNIVPPVFSAAERSKVAGMGLMIALVTAVICSHGLV